MAEGKKPDWLLPKEEQRKKIQEQSKGTLIDLMPEEKKSPSFNFRPSRRQFLKSAIGVAGAGLVLTRLMPYLNLTEGDQSSEQAFDEANSVMLSWYEKMWGTNYDARDKTETMGHSLKYMEALNRYYVEGGGGVKNILQRRRGVMPSQAQLSVEMRHIGDISPSSLTGVFEGPFKKKIHDQLFELQRQKLGLTEKDKADYRVSIPTSLLLMRADVRNPLTANLGVSFSVVGQDQSGPFPAAVQLAVDRGEKTPTGFVSRLVKEGFDIDNRLLRGNYFEFLWKEKVGENTDLKGKSDVCSAFESLTRELGLPVMWLYKEPLEITRKIGFFATKFTRKKETVFEENTRLTTEMKWEPQEVIYEGKKATVTLSLMAETVGTRWDDYHPFVTFVMEIKADGEKRKIQVRLERFNNWMINEAFDQTTKGGGTRKDLTKESVLRSWMYSQGWLGTANFSFVPGKDKPAKPGSLLSKQL